MPESGAAQNGCFDGQAGNRREREYYWHGVVTCGRRSDMRCSACELELILTSVVQDAAPGFERHNFICPECNARADRIVFMRNGREEDVASIPMHLAPSIVSAFTVQEEHNAAPGILGRWMSRLLRY